VRRSRSLISAATAEVIEVALAGAPCVSAVAGPAAQAVARTRPSAETARSLIRCHSREQGAQGAGCPPVEAPAQLGPAGDQQRE
jgi:hypothetical protein